MKFLFILLFIPSFSQKTSKIEWSEKRHLRWSDFIYDPNCKDAAFAMTEIQMSITDGPDWVAVDAKAMFDPSKSCTSTYSFEVLAHENCHFGITELNRRRFLDALSTSTKPLTRAYVDSVYKVFCDKWQAMEDLFDKETDNSRNNTAERAWEVKIDQELNKK